MNVKEYFQPKNWRNFVEGNITYAKWKIQRDHFPDHILEQFVFRAYLCRDCLKNGRCLVCNCSTPGMFFAPGKKDSKNRWPGYESNLERWTQIKQNDNDWKIFSKLLEEAVLDIRSDDIFNFISSIPIEEPDKRVENRKSSVDPAQFNDRKAA